jgi:hypothetical protein
MDVAEKALLIKVLEGLSTTHEKSESSNDDENAHYLKEPKGYLDKLYNRVKALEEHNEFNIGDFLIWKEGLKNKRVPSYNQPAVVIKKHDPPLVDEDTSFNESMDIQLGFITEDDEFLIFNYDSNRFKLMDNRL